MTERNELTARVSRLEEQLRAKLDDAEEAKENLSPRPQQRKKKLMEETFSLCSDVSVLDATITERNELMAKVSGLEALLR
ncbi:unnamed protein product, partial [Ascophyllum nodosum]